MKIKLTKKSRTQACLVFSLTDFGGLAMGKKAKKRKGFGVDQNYRKAKEKTLFEEERLFRETINSIEQGIAEAAREDRTYFAILENKGKGYPKSVRDRVEQYFSDKDLPVEAHLYLKPVRHE